MEPLKQVAAAEHAGSPASSAWWLRIHTVNIRPGKPIHHLQQWSPLVPHSASWRSVRLCSVCKPQAWRQVCGIALPHSSAQAMAMPKDYWPDAAPCNNGTSRGSARLTC